MSSAIEFRVQGPNSKPVAEELGRLLEHHFEVKPVLRASETGSGDGAGTKSGLEIIGGAILILEIGWKALEHFKFHPEEHHKADSIRRWESIVRWSERQLPTRIQAKVGEQSLFLHESVGDRLHHLTHKLVGKLEQVPVVSE